MRKLVETTSLTYGEIAARTGVGRASICRWTRDAQWQRHLFAPRATDTIPRERAGAQLRMRTVAARLAALAERYLRELEETPGVDLAKLGEALALYQLARFALRRRRPRRRSSKLKADLRRLYPRENSSPLVPAKAGTQGQQAQEQVALDSRLRGNERDRPYDLSALPADTPPYLRLWMELANAGVDMDRAPDAAVKDFIKSRIYEDVGLRPKNRTKRQREEDWMREKI
ncbi:MAG: hypothetical protein ACK4UO_07795 [Pseudolabrys sp.]